jgi:hypothetical protein
MAHNCNPSYSGGRDQKDYSSNPVTGKYFVNPISKLCNTKKTGRLAQVSNKCLEFLRTNSNCNPIKTKQNKEATYFVLANPVKHMNIMNFLLPLGPHLIKFPPPNSSTSWQEIF